jgi:predicted alpha/beta-hydrolase family hydrolase
MPDVLPDLIFDGPAAATLTIALAHGAGAPMDSPFMDAIAAGLAAHGWRVGRFEFPYMAARRTEGRKKPPDREPSLRATWQAVIDRLGANGTVIGGKSMGGRIASLVADDAGVRGLICLGYPFHPPGKPDRLRTAHLADLRTPTLILQGERDALGTREEIAGYRLSGSIELGFLPDGDHSFKPRKASGHTEAGNIDVAVARIDEFLSRIAGR